MIYRLKVTGEEAWELLYPLVNSILFAEEDRGSYYLWVDAASPPSHPSILEVEERELPSYDWEKQWEQHAPGFVDGSLPIEIGGKQLTLLPGPGFGDLSHPTTQLMLEMMPGIVYGQHTLDIGCGSGILSMAAVICDAESVWAIDIDPEALEHTRRNADHNHFKIEIGRLPNVKPLVVLINMILSEQREAVKSIASLREDISDVVCSGILVGEEDSVLELWPGFEIVSFSQNGEWLGLHLKSRALI